MARKDTSVYPENQNPRGPQAVLFIAAPAGRSGHSLFVVCFQILCHVVFFFADKQPSFLHGRCLFHPLHFGVFDDSTRLVPMILWILD